MFFTKLLKNSVKNSIKKQSINSGLLIKRPPLQLKNADSFEQSYYKFKDTQTRENSLNFTKDFYFRKGTTSETIWENALLKDKQSDIFRLEELQESELEQLSKNIQTESKDIERFFILIKVVIVNSIIIFICLLWTIKIQIIQKVSLLIKELFWKLPHGDLLEKEFLHDVFLFIKGCK